MSAISGSEESVVPDGSPPLIERVGARLQRVPVVWNLAALSLRAVSQPRRSHQIEDYLARSQVRKLRIGAGRHTDKTWLCADLLPKSRNTVYMDATQPLPLPTASFDWIVCEHMIEHLPLRGARSMLAECRRILRPGGTVRIATPDIGRLMRFTCDREEGTDDFWDYVVESNSCVADIPESERRNPIYMINRMVREWGHQFLFDEATLSALLREAGFCDIVSSAPGVSTHPELVGVERHQELVGERNNLVETMVLEAAAPALAIPWAASRGATIAGVT